MPRRALKSVENTRTALLDTAERLFRQVGYGKTTMADIAEALYHFVEREIQNDPSLDGPELRSAECLRGGSGDPAAKSRLLVALLRQCGIPARFVLGLTLQKGPSQHVHTWVEAWVRDRWVPMDAFHHHFGKVPGTYLVFAIGTTGTTQSSLRTRRQRRALRRASCSIAVFAQ